MQTIQERRRNPRLSLCYPIEARVQEHGEAGQTRAVTSNLGARGAYFKTFSWEHFREGQRVAVRIRVPHQLQAGSRDMELDMTTNGSIRRLDEVRGREAWGEDGIVLKGVAVEFDAPLEFRYFWT